MTARPIRGVHDSTAPVGLATITSRLASPVLWALALPGLLLAGKPERSSEDAPPSVAQIVVKDAPDLHWIGEDEFGRTTTSPHRQLLKGPRPFLWYERLVPAAATRLGTITSPIGVGLVDPNQESLHTIASARAVRYLSLCFDKCPDWLPASLPRLTHVTYLHLKFTQSPTCPPDLLASLAALDNLAHLSLEDVNVGGQDNLGAFFEMPLVSMSLGSCDGLGMIFNERLASLPNLRSVSISNTPLSKRTTGAIARNASVDTVSLRACELSADAIEALAGLKNLRGLDLEGVALDKEAMLRVAKFRCLEKLSLRSSGVDDAVIRSLTNPRLRMLWVSGKRVTNEAVKTFMNMRELKNLDLACTAVDDAGVSLLARHLSLTHLGLSGTDVTDESVRALTDARVPSIDLYGTRLSTEGLVKLASASHLQRLLIGTEGRPAGAILRIRDARPKAEIIISD